MKELKNYKGVIILFLILTIIVVIPMDANSTEYVKGNNEQIESEVAVNI